MNVLVFYDASQTYTNTVFEHLDYLAKYSRNDVVFCSHLAALDCLHALDSFDAIVLHYSVRLPYDQVVGPLEEVLVAFTKLKALFIQDEYDHTHRAWYWIRRLGFQLVFTTVPDPSISKIYPPAEFPGVTFVSNLTGYVPESLGSGGAPPPPSTRSLVVAYRGRTLAPRYGALGADKQQIGELVKAYCAKEGIAHDIDWKDEKRIYGPAWYKFVSSARSMLGTESGSNVFDWDGTLDAEIALVKERHPEFTARQIYEAVIQPLELPGTMNQISPRAFESIALRTVLVLFEGSYSGILQADRHYLALRRDGKNLKDIFAALSDGRRIDELASAAYDDTIGSGRYSYAVWASMIDDHLIQCAQRLSLVPREMSVDLSATAITVEPLRALPPAQPVNTLRAAIFSAVRPSEIPKRVLEYTWARTPLEVRALVPKRFRTLIRKSL